MLAHAGKDVGARPGYDPAARSRRTPLPDDRQELAAEVTALARLHEANTRLWALSDLRAGLEEMLDASMSLLGATMGNVQLLNSATANLEIVAHVGFETPFLDFFREVSADDDSACGRSLRTGGRIVVDDVETDAAYAPFRAVAEAAGYRAVQSTPLVGRDGKALGMLSTHFREPHRPTEQEFRRLDLYVRQAADFIERKRLDEALARSEQKYRTLFDTINQGFFLAEVIHDAAGTVIDYRHLETNPASERLTGLRGIAGKRASEVVPRLDAEWLAPFADVFREGGSRRIEHYNNETGRWCEAFYSRVGGTGSRLVAVVFDDITERKRRERNLAFLADTSQDLVRLTHITDTIQVLGAKIAAHFQVARCNFASIDDAAGEAVITGDWHQPSLADIASDRVHRLSDFMSAALARSARAGEMLVVCDTRTDPRTDEAAYAAIGTRAFVTAPFLRDGAWHSLISISEAVPREWRDDDVELLRELTLRIWTRLERARAEEALRRAHDELEQRVQERTSELAQANAQLQTEVAERRAAQAQIKALFDRLVSVQEDERQRIARDIHDHLGQQLTGLRMNLESARSWANGDPARMDHAERTARLAEELDRSIDFLTWELRPAALEPFGLVAALQRLVSGWSERFGIAAEFDTAAADGVRLLPDAEANLYRLTQEALHNIVKHAAATNVSVLLQHRDHQVVLVIEDNGRGFSVDDVEHRAGGGGLGLVSMRERALLAGGVFEIESAPDRGTTLFVRVPAR